MWALLKKVFALWQLDSSGYILSFFVAHAGARRHGENGIFAV